MRLFKQSPWSLVLFENPPVAQLLKNCNCSKQIQNPQCHHKRSELTQKLSSVQSVAFMQQSGLTTHSARMPKLPKHCTSKYCKIILISDNNVPRSVTEVRGARPGFTRDAGPLSLQGSLVMPVIYIFLVPSNLQPLQPC
jgi:hypothetical protein